MRWGGGMMTQSAEWRNAMGWLLGHLGADAIEATAPNHRPPQG